MSFSANTPEAINDMIEHGIYGTAHLNFNEYLSSMIEEFFPDANLGIIKKMIHWSRYPTLNLITLKELQEIEINERTKEFNEGTASSEEAEKFNLINSQLREWVIGNEFTYYINRTTNGSWNTLYMIISKNGGFGISSDTELCVYRRHIRHYPKFIKLYVNFVEIVQSIWNSSNKRDMIMEEHESTQINIQEDANDKDTQITELKNENQLMKNQLTILKSKVDALERKHAPELIEYDYELIKSHIDPFRDELKMTQRIFARIIQNRNII